MGYPPSVSGSDWDQTGSFGGESLGGPNLLDTLAMWTAEARVDEAIRSRSRERWLRQQAEESSTFTGVLADLADRGRAVMVQSAGGRRHRGVVTAVGVDFVALRTDQGKDVLLATEGISSVRPQARETRALSGRTLELSYRLVEAIAALAEERPRVLLVTSEVDGTMAGELWTVGQDVITLRVDGETRSNVYVRLGAVMELSLA